MMDMFLFECHIQGQKVSLNVTFGQNGVRPTKQLFYQLKCMIFHNFLPYSREKSCLMHIMVENLKIYDVLCSRLLNKNNHLFYQDS